MGNSKERFFSPRPEAYPPYMQPVVSELRQVDYSKIKERLDSKKEVDPTANIVVVDNSDLESVSIQDRVYHFHDARVYKGTAVATHRHPEKGQLPGQSQVKGPDDEPYYFHTPGEMNTAPFSDGKVGEWTRDTMQAGEIFNVRPNMEHTLRAVEDSTDITFACPDDHLVNYDLDSNPEGNRVMAARADANGTLVPLVANGIPPWYPQSS